MKKITTQQLVAMAFCLMLGLCVKRVISPFTGILTDFFRIPGGSTATGFSLAFLVLGTTLAPFPGAGAMMGFAQGSLSLIMGMSGYQGIFCIITYTLPGAMIDIANLLFMKRETSFFVTAGAASSIVAALCSNCLVFHLTGTALMLWLLLAFSSGILGGAAGHELYKKIAVALQKGRYAAV